jgi:YidC/Oxa1 family membrane protein insertase
MNFYDVVFHQPVVNLFYGVFVLSRDVGIATVLMSLIIRLVMWPFIKKSYITGQKTRLVQPLIKQIQKAYKGNIMGQQEALKKLYLKYDIKASLSGLIILLQLPIYIALFNLIQNVPKSDRLDGLYEFIFGTTQLSINKYAFGIIDITETGTPTVIGLSILTLIFTFLMAKYIFPPSSNPPKEKSKGETSEKKPDQIIDSEVFNKTLQFQMTYFMPVVSFVINLTFPAGLNIYFLAGTIFSFIQQYRLAKKYRIDKPQIESDEEIIPKSLLKESEKANNTETVTDKSKIIDVESSAIKNANKPNKNKKLKNGAKKSKK